MNPAQYQSDRAVVLRQQSSGYWAAIPRPLPPDIQFTADIAQRLAEAERAIGQLAGGAAALPNPFLFARPFMQREAVLSSRIEGTQASLSDLFYFEASDEREGRTTDVQEVANYVAALEFGLRRLEDLPLSIRLLTELHNILVADPTKTPGQLRTSKNWIGGPGCLLNTATYVPPPPDDMKSALYELESFIHAPAELPPLVRYALIHYQFEAIHPFLDGNGRIGRLLITLLLCADPVEEKPLLGSPLLYLSAFFERERDTYYARLLAVSQKGEWEEWLIFFLRGIIEEAKDAQARSIQLLELMRTYKAMLYEARGSNLAGQIVDQLFISPVVSVGQLARSLKRTHAGVQTAIDKLCGLGFIAEGTGRSRNRLYVSADILRLLE